MRLLLIDQYELFSQKQPDTAPNLIFRFTGAPVKGRLSADNEHQFWRRLEEQSNFSKDNLAYPIGRIHSDPTPTHQKDDDDRRCAETWDYFVPNADHLAELGTNPNIRVVDIHLMDSNDTLIWRNLTSLFIENEQRIANVADKNETPLPKPADMLLMIRLRYCAKEARQRTVDERAKLKTTFAASTERQNYLKQLMLSAAKLRFKRFAAFFAKIIELKCTMRHAPRLFWTMRYDEQAVIRLIYHEIFREAVKGKLSNVVCYDRFLKIDKLISKRNNIDKDNQPESADHHHSTGLISARCTMRESTAIQKKADNTLGIIQNVLMHRAAFASTLYFIAPGGVYIAKHKSGAPIYKLRTHEI